MSGVSRFLSRRDKRRSSIRQKKSGAEKADLLSIFTPSSSKKLDKEEEKKIKTISTRLAAAGFTNLNDQHIEYALRSENAQGDADKATSLLVLFADSLEGILKDYRRGTKLLGAVNREGVTCYLDALLFAMFARLDSFEAMLFDNFSDQPRKKLATLLRLWVNLLRTGELITTDITMHLQEELKNCGWEEAADLCQQDASEAFTFITGKLELPLLTLKMDIYHVGRENKEDDHKFVNERLLEVAIPELDDGEVLTLEHCLELYFNNRIEVKRHLQRRNTVQSAANLHLENSTDTSKDGAVHIEAVELSGPETPTVSTPTVSTPTSFLPPNSPLRPTAGRRRADSIFSERYVDAGIAEKKDDERVNSSGRPRGASIRKEVLMPAWQFFSLIPWYTNNAPTNDAQVAAHFSSKRPVLGICLKRYSMTPKGKPKRLGTYIDVPIEIALPHFVSDDNMDEQGPVFGNFKLSLQSVVCHQGVSVDAGHYISYARDHEAAIENSSAENLDEPLVKWLKFDDLAKDRITTVDIKTELRKESPYLLFYQVQPIDDESSQSEPPPYSEAESDTLLSTKKDQSTVIVTPLGDLDDLEGTTTVLSQGTSIVSTNTQSNVVQTPSTSATLATDSSDTQPRFSISSHRRSVNLDEASLPSTVPPTVPTTPLEELEPVTSGGAGALSRSRHEPKRLKSRQSSQTGENRLSMTLLSLSGRKSKDKLVYEPSPTADHQSVSDAANVPGTARNPANSEKKEEKKEKAGDRLSRIMGKDTRKEKKEKGKGVTGSSRPASREGSTIIAAAVKAGGDAAVTKSEGTTDSRTKKKAPDRECGVM